MKKITLLLFITFSFTFQAQNVVIDQPNDAAGTSLVCFEGNDGIGVYTSDDFVLTGDTILGEIDVFGRLSNVTNFGNLLSFNIFIYADAGGLPAGDPSQPGTGVVELNVTSTDFTLTEDGVNSADFTVRMTDANGGVQITLPAGTYWLSAFPIVDEPFATGGANRWNWNASTAASSGVDPVLIDPDNTFGAGATTWTNIGSLIGAAYPSHGFIIRDEPELSVDEFAQKQVSIYPNPAEDQITIEVNDSNEIDNIEIYAVTGQLVYKGANQNQVDISALSPGVYLMKVSTFFGESIKRLVKN